MARCERQLCRSVCHSTRTAPSVSKACCEQQQLRLGVDPGAPARPRGHGVPDRDAPVDLVDRVVGRGADDLAGTGVERARTGPAVPCLVHPQRLGDQPGHRPRAVRACSRGRNSNTSSSAMAANRPSTWDMSSGSRATWSPRSGSGVSQAARVPAEGSPGTGTVTPGAGSASPGTRRSGSTPAQCGSPRSSGSSMAPPIRALTDTSVSGDRQHRGLGQLATGSAAGCRPTGRRRPSPPPRSARAASPRRR